MRNTNDRNEQAREFAGELDLPVADVIAAMRAAEEHPIILKLVCSYLENAALNLAMLGDEEGYGRIGDIVWELGEIDGRDYRIRPTVHIEEA